MNLREKLVAPGTLVGATVRKKGLGLSCTPTLCCHGEGSAALLSPTSGVECFA